MPGKPRILVVDDELGLQKLLRRHADREGLEVVKAVTSAQGFSEAIATCPDLVLLDLHLPDGSGIDLLRKLKFDVRTAKIPVVAWSGSDFTAGEAELLRAGAAAYFAKGDLKRLIAR